MIQQLLFRIANEKPFFHPVVRGFPGVPARTAFLPSLVALAARARDEARPLRILEVGRWVGSSALAWVEGLRDACAGEGTVYCVDLWHTDSSAFVFEPGAMALANEWHQIGYEVFRYNVQVAGAQPWVVPMLGDSRKVLPALAPASFDIVYVDGYHGYEIATEDIAHAKRLVRDGGIVCGDDLELQVHECDAAALARDRHLDDGVEPTSGRPYHPGVTAAVDEHFGRVRPHIGLWAMRRLGGEHPRWEPVALETLPVSIPRYFPTGRATEALRTLYENGWERADDGTHRHRSARAHETKTRCASASPPC